MQTFVLQGPHRVRGGRLAAAALLLALAACSDAATAPEPPATRAAASADGLTLSARRDDAHTHGRLTANRQKYRDRAGHATARSGSATLSALALLAPGGTTWLTVTTGDLEALDAAPGELSQLQVKAYGPDGDPLFTRNFHRSGEGGSVTLPFPGLMPGAKLCVKANVRGIDGPRTDVVSLCDTVKLAPELRATLTAPGVALVGAPTVITATVTEVKGQAGARADCELWVDGVKVDAAEGIWVDAGDAVTCAFTHAFATPGEHQVEVRVVTSDTPGFLPTVVTSSAVVDVATPNTATFSAQAEEKRVETVETLEYRWEKPDGGHKEYQQVATSGTRSQSLVVSGALPRAAAFPLARVDLEVESNGSVYHDQAWVALAGALDASGRLCVSQAVAEQGAMFHLCSGAAGTTFGYTRFAGTVTYHSRGFSRTWDGPTGAQTQNYSWNGDFTEFSPTGGQIKPWGSDVRVRLSITDAGGTYGASPVIPLAPFGSTNTSPRSCTLEYHYWLDGNAQETCTFTEVRETGRRGTAQG